MAQWLNPFQDELFEDGYHVNASAVPARSQAAGRPTFKKSFMPGILRPSSPIAPPVEPLSPILPTMTAPRIIMGPPPRPYTATAGGPSNKRGAEDTADGGEESASKRRRV
ncbi:hypothetical protein BDV97DRAFT_361855 [Delphinella strobiligena]|nr:hypothetical protein BDV97DRAFT_361855 [Delphinella strobiligena]